MLTSYAVYYYNIYCMRSNASSHCYLFVYVYVIIHLISHYYSTLINYYKHHMYFHIITGQSNVYSNNEIFYNRQYGD